MAEQKARSFLFKIPAETGLREIKTAIEEITGENAITVFRQSGISEYLVELSDADQVREIIEHGFDFDDHHIDCNLPHGYYLNVSIMGLKAYVDDDAVTEKQRILHRKHLNLKLQITQHKWILYLPKLRTRHLQELNGNIRQIQTTATPTMALTIDDLQRKPDA